MGFKKHYGFQAEIRCVGFPPSFLRSKKITLELLAVVPPEGYMLAPGNLLGNLLNEGQSLGRGQRALSEQSGRDPRTYSGNFL